MGLPSRQPGFDGTVDAWQAWGPGEVSWQLALPELATGKGVSEAWQWLADRQTGQVLLQDYSKQSPG